MKTITAKAISGSDRKWYIIDANSKNLGKLASKIATILRGKNKVDFTPHLDNGDYVVVINCDKFSVTGKKLTDKIYYKHTRFLGGLKEIALVDLLEKKPLKALEKAVSGMLPKNKLKRSMFSRLKLFTGAEHTFIAQKPKILEL